MKTPKFLTLLLIVALAGGCSHHSNEELLTNGIWGRQVNYKSYNWVQDSEILDSLLKNDWHYMHPFKFYDGNICIVKEDGLKPIMSYVLSGDTIFMSNNELEEKWLITELNETSLVMQYINESTRFKVYYKKVDDIEKMKYYFNPSWWEDWLPK